MENHKIVEVVVEGGGDLHPVGIMNVGQALALAEILDAKFSHPDHEAGGTDLFVDRRELAVKASQGR